MSRFLLTSQFHVASQPTRPICRIAVSNQAMKKLDTTMQIFSRTTLWRQPLWDKNVSPPLWSASKRKLRTSKRHTSQPRERSAWSMNTSRSMESQWKRSSGFRWSDLCRSPRFRWCWSANKSEERSTRRRLRYKVWYVAILFGRGTKRWKDRDLRPLWEFKGHGEIMLEGLSFPK